MKVVGAFEAKNKLGHLLDLVEQGEEVTITRHGKDVARIVPARSRPGRDAGARRNSAHPRARRSGEAWPVRLGGMEGLPRRRPAVSLVLDSSAALAWIYDDEATDPIRHVFNTVAEQGAFVPSLWRLEIANSLTAAVRRGRVDHEFRRAALADLGDLDIIVDAERTHARLECDARLCRSLPLDASMTPLMSSSRRGARCRWQLSTATCKEPALNSA